jgi:hypothetical protein
MPSERTRLVLCSTWKAKARASVPLESGPEGLMAMGTAGGLERERLFIRARWIPCSSLGILGARL